MFGVNKENVKRNQVKDDVRLVHVYKTLTAFLQFDQLKAKVESWEYIKTLENSTETELLHSDISHLLKKNLKSVDFDFVCCHLD